MRTISPGRTTTFGPTGRRGRAQIPRMRHSSSKSRRDRLAMQALFARHHTGFYRFVLRMVGDVAAAEDLTSDVFLSVRQQAHRFEARSWRSRLAVGNCLLQGAAELRRRPQAATSDEDGPDVSDTADTPEIAFEIKHRGEICANAWRGPAGASGRRSISSMITRNQCRKSPRSPEIVQHLSKPACLMHAKYCPSCSKPKAL